MIRGQQLLSKFEVQYSSDRHYDRVPIPGSWYSWKWSKMNPLQSLLPIWDVQTMPHTFAQQILCRKKGKKVYDSEHSEGLQDPGRQFLSNCGAVQSKPPKVVRISCESIKC